MNEPKKIGWTPLCFNFDNIDEENDDEEDEDEDFLEEYDDHSYASSPITLKLPKILMTPFGPFKIDDTLNPFRHFEFWMGSTNFNITRSVLETLEKTPGIEKLILQGRYSFIIGIGKMFKFHDVRVRIQEQLCGSEQSSMDDIQNQDVRNILLNRYEKLAKNKYWALIILPNGSIDEAVSDELNDDFTTMLNLFKESRDNCHSILFCSHKELVENGQT